MRRARVAVVGNPGVGKSSLCTRMIYDRFSLLDEIDPTLEEVYTKEITLSGKSCMLHLEDSAGRQQLPPDYWPFVDTHGFLLVYSITSRSSFLSTHEFYEKIVGEKEKERISVALVGCKCDLESEREVSIQEAQQLADSLGIPLFETSSHLRVNIEEVFMHVLQELEKLGFCRPPRPPASFFPTCIVS